MNLHTVEGKGDLFCASILCEFYLTSMGDQCTPWTSIFAKFNAKYISIFLNFCLHKILILIGKHDFTEREKGVYFISGGESRL